MKRLIATTGLVFALTGCSQNVPPAPVGRTAPPSAVNTPPPGYPESLACAGVGGTVQLRVLIGVDGHVANTELVAGSGSAELDKSAEAAVRDWTFNPALQAGKPTQQWITVPMTFHVPSERPEACDAREQAAVEALQKK
ncbi:energy transducer TonB [Lysobacter sp. TY2-98]|uniref:energy transducer TonB n=1 Tax=Lysobacter sp. TY2-98 TaxID=2290922 RepID=UPI0013B3E60A|nr:energy transducer TonB [Lysobacter sp. TY2-98]